MTRRKALADQLKNEPMQDYIKFLVYIEAGNRNLDKAYRQYYETQDEASEVWHKLAVQYRWDERAAQYDELNKAAS